MQTEAYFDRVCQALGYSESAGFLQNESDTTDLREQAILKEAKEKLGIDAVYLIQTAPNTRPMQSSILRNFKLLTLMK